MSGMKNRKFFDEITDRTGTHSIKLLPGTGGKDVDSVI